MLNFEMTFKNPYANFHNHQKNMEKRDRKLFFFGSVNRIYGETAKSSFFAKKPTKKLEIPYHQSREKRTEEKSNKKLFKIMDEN